VKALLVAVVAGAALAASGVAGAALAASGVAGAATHPAKDNAYRSARACLLHHGASQVGRRGNDGGWALFNGKAGTGSMYWTYKETLWGTAIESAQLYYGLGRLPQATLRTIKTCVYGGI